MAFYVYILSNETNSKYIIGFTRNLIKQIHEVKTMQDGVYSREKINKLIYYEAHAFYEEAKKREREIISWDDDYTKTIVSLRNSRFEDLFERIF